jgi:hypothetical protein
MKWAAGFIEGEGNFDPHPCIRVGQVQKWPLEKLHTLFGGKIYFEQRSSRNKTINHSDIWEWRLGSINSIALMMTLYTLMSPKRKDEIKKCINSWKKQKVNKYSSSYPCGHRRTSSNTYYHINGTKRCRACERIRSQIRNKRKAQAHHQSKNINQLTLFN